MLPRIFFSVNGSPVELDDWSFGNQAALGYDQFRAVAAASRARKIVGGIEQGSAIKAFTESGAVVWEGTVSADPKLSQDGLAFVVGQGYGYQGTKSGDRITPLITAPGAWVPANHPPLNWPVTTNMSVTYANSLLERSFSVVVTGGGDRWAVALPAKGMQLTQLRFERHQILGANDHIRIWTADYPDIARTARLQGEIDTTTNPSTFTVAFGVSGDVVIFEVIDVAGGSVGSGQDVFNPVVWGDYALDAIYSHHAAWIVARQLGWDTIGVTGRGIAPHPALDWTGDAGGFLSYIAGLEDFCWGVWEDAGSGPVLQFSPYGPKTWEVSGATGARWEMDPLERVRRITVQFFNVDNSFNEVSLEPPDVVGLPASITTELKGSLTDSQSGIGMPLSAAWNLLQRYSAQRYRGRISFARAFDSNDHRDAPFEVRAGDLIKIVDFSLDGSITLRIHSVEFSPGGVTVGVEAAAFPLGGSITGGGTPVRAVGLGPQIASSTGGTATYIPPGFTPAPDPGVPGNWEPPGGGWGGGK